MPPRAVAPAMPLDNPPENPCFGCGPAHPRGLRLRFERDGDAVHCTYAPKADEIGWPGLMHTGLHFTVLYEASYWAALELSGNVHTSHGPAAFEQLRLPRVGQPFRATARIAERAAPGAAAPGFALEAASATLEGKPLATLRTLWQPASRARVQKAGLDVPAYLLEDMLP